jgi:hypothetical protein
VVKSLVEVDHRALGHQKSLEVAASFLVADPEAYPRGGSCLQEIQEEIHLEVVLPCLVGHFEDQVVGEHSYDVVTARLAALGEAVCSPMKDPVLAEDVAEFASVVGEDQKIVALVGRESVGKNLDPHRIQAEVAFAVVGTEQHVPVP